MANENGNKIKLLVLWNILCKNTDENHAMNADEIREELEKRGISVMRKVVATDIAALNNFGYEVVSNCLPENRSIRFTSLMFHHMQIIRTLKTNRSLYYFFAKDFFGVKIPR